MTRKQYAKDTQYKTSDYNNDLELSEQTKYEQYVDSELKQHESFNIDQIIDIYDNIVRDSYILESCRSIHLSEFFNKPNKYYKMYQTRQPKGYNVFLHENYEEINACFTIMKNNYRIVSQKNCNIQQWKSFCYHYSMH